MFFVRLSETSNNWMNTFKKFVLTSDIEIKDFIDPDQPLTAIINKTLNLEFISCILNGLCQISQRNNKKVVFVNHNEISVSISKIVQSSEIEKLIFIK